MAVIDFACKRVPIEEIIKCSFAINKTDYLVFKELMKNNEINTLEIAEKLNKDRTTIQRSIKNLLKKNLIFRRQINLESGGFMYCYSIKEKDEVKKRIYANFDNWQRKVLNEVEAW